MHLAPRQLFIFFSCDVHSYVHALGRAIPFHCPLFVAGFKNTCTALNPARCLQAPRLMLLACSHRNPFTTLRTPAAPALQPRRPSVRTAPAFPLRLLLQPQVQHYTFQSRSEVMLSQRRDQRLLACRLEGSRHRCFVCSRCVQGLYLARSCPAPAASLPLPRETCTGENARAHVCVRARQRHRCRATPTKTAETKPSPLFAVPDELSVDTHVENPTTTGT